MLAAHRKICAGWRGQLGTCDTCKRRYYRHVQGCANEGEDLNRRRLLERHDINLDDFEVLLRVLARRYRQIVHSPLTH